MKSLGSTVAALIVLTGSVARAEADLHGFTEFGVGVRTTSNAEFDADQDFTLEEVRAQLQMNHYGEAGELFLRLDFLRDVLDRSSSEVEPELREAYARFSTLGDHLEVKAGRQALTWGTGDLIFVNDLFPKDWVSFFSGRDDQYLKAPADALRLGFFGLPFDAEVVWIPEFTPDRLPSGERFSFFLPGGVNHPPLTPANEVKNSEVAARLSGYLGSAGWAVYGYSGFWPTPEALFVGNASVDPIVAPYHPVLITAGGSLRGGVAGGVASAEVGYYNSNDDTDGDDPLVPNSQLRGVIGFERQLFTDFNVGVQAYAEWMRDHDAYLDSLPAETPDRLIDDEWRQIITLRVEKMLFYQTLRLSLFTFGSPSDEDIYSRALVSYKTSDEVELAAGANLFGGKNGATMFGQFDGNDNVWTRVRYSF